MTKAIYAFSGDPITYGHIDIVDRASKLFDDLIVAIGVNPEKTYTFSLDERREMATQALSKFTNVKVVTFKGLLVDYAYEQGINVVVKGLRDEKDFEYETVLHQAGRSQELGIDTVFLPANPELLHISSSVVKAIQQEHGQVHKYVPLNVKQMLEFSISGQTIIGITGEIGSGKSYIAEKFVEMAKEQGIEAHNIELDHIGHKILETLKEPVYQKARDQIVKTFGVQVKAKGGMIDRKKLGEAVFKSDEKLKKLNGIMHELILVRLRKEIYNKRGLVIITAALFAETGMAFLFNNNCILLDVSDSVQKKRLAKRGYTPEQIKTRLHSQFDFDHKKAILKAQIADQQNGKLWVIQNDDIDDENLTKQFTRIAQELKLL